MAIVTEAIRVVVSGANPQTKTFSVLVDTSTGAGLNPLTIPLSGVNAGTDTVQAFMDSHSLTSNQATVAWQAVNGQIAVGPVTIDSYANNAKTRGWPGGLFSGASDFGRTFPFLNAAPGANSLVWNEVFPNYPIRPFTAVSNGGAGSGGFKLCPTVVVNQTSTGTFSTTVPINGTSDGANGNADNGSDHPGFVLNAYGSLVVQTPGTYTFYTTFANKSGMCLWIKGATSSGNNGPNTADSRTGAFPAASPKFGYTPIILVSTNNAAPLFPNTVSSFVNFPTAGIYQFELIYNQWAMTQFSGDDNSFFQITYLQGTQNQSVGQGNGNTGPQMFPVPVATAPPTGATPTGQLRLTPVGGSAGLQVQGSTDNLTLTIQNVTYNSIPYCPILEGTAGSLFITNSGAQFTFPTYNNSAVNTTAAASSVFTITADNGAISGLFNITSTGATPAPFKFNYNGNPFTFAVPGAQVSSSSVTVTADDVAWFDPNGNKFDVFNGGSGATAFSLDVDYMTKPGIASVSPINIAAGATTAVTINLTKSMSPQQQGLFGTSNSVNISGLLTNGCTFGSVFTPILDSAGFLQGWSTSIVAPPSSTNGTTQLSLTISGTLTFLSDTTFVTGTVTYVSGPVATLNTTGGFFAPVGVSLTTSPASTSLSGTTPTTIIGTEYTFDNLISGSMQFYYVPAAGGAQVNLGSSSSPVSQTTTTVGGQTVFQKTYQISHQFTTIPVSVPAEAGIQLGFNFTDNTSGLTGNYQSTTAYSLPFTVITGGGGGGGGGCFTETVAIQTPSGLREFGDLPRDEEFEITNETGVHKAVLIVHEFYADDMVVLDGEKMVTVGHAMKTEVGDWIPAMDFYAGLPHVRFEGTVYNLHILSDKEKDHHYILWNGDVAHNVIKANTL